MRRPITGGGELAQRLLEVQLLEQLFLYPQWHPAGKSGSHVGRWRDRFPIGSNFTRRTRHLSTLSRLMPAASIHEQDGMGALRHGLRDLGQMQGYGCAVAERGRTRPARAGRSGARSGCRAWASGMCACSSGRCGPRPGTTPLDARGLPALDLRQEVGEVF